MTDKYNIPHEDKKSLEALFSNIQLVWHNRSLIYEFDLINSLKDKKLMTNTMEMLFQLNKKWIMTSKFQNNIYKGQEVCKYLGEKPTTFKIGESFYALLLKMLDKIPPISYEKLVKHRYIYEKYPHLYLRFIGKHNYLINIGEFCKHIDNYAEYAEIPIDFYLPSFFSRYYTIRWFNIITKTTRDERYDAPHGEVPTKAKDIFLYLVYFQRTYEEILETTDWADYESLIVELKNARFNERKRQ